MPNIFLTAQNIDIYDSDTSDLFARTGSTSIEQVAKAGAQGVILGHPETNDTAEVVKQKLKTVVDRARVLQPTFQNRIILMAGESWEGFQGHSHDEIAATITAQLADIMLELPHNYLPNLTIAYDPKWGSRGSGHDDAPPPEPALIFSVSAAVRKMLAEKYGGDISAKIPVIYGGRSTPERTVEIVANPNIDGLILGSACNTVQKTKDIADAMTKAKPRGRKVLHANFKAFNVTDSYEEYVDMFSKLDDSFLIFMSPCHADLRKAAEALA